MKRKKNFSVFFLAGWLIFFLLSLGGQEKNQPNAEEKTLRLAIGEPKLRDKLVRVRPGEIISSRTGQPVSFSKMIEEMAGARFVFVGESHDSLAMHEIQLQIIEALYRKDQSLAIGLEMLPVQTQPVLNHWREGLLAEEDFLRQVEWYVHWNMNFGFYRRIFYFARENHIPLFALNVPRNLITRIRMEGWESLAEEEKRIIPPLDLSSSEHRLLIRTIFESTDLPHRMKGEGLDNAFEGLYRAQAAWDEAMAHHAILLAEQSNSRMLVLAGSAHLLYGLGVNGRVREKTGLPSRTVIIVPIAPGEEPVSVARSLADYIWGILTEERPAFPPVGLALKKIERLENLIIERQPVDGVALAADFQKGDIILAVDDRPFMSVNELRMYLARFGWGEKATFHLLRDGEMKAIVLEFKTPPPPAGMVEAKASPNLGKGVAKENELRIGRLERQLKRLIEEVQGEVGLTIKHLESGAELSIHGETLFPMASVFKIPILVEVLAQAGEGKFALDDEVSIEKKDQHLGSGIISNLVSPGIKLSVRNLIQLMMMVSDNSATDILLEKVGAENVNRRMAAYGISGLRVDRTCQELIMDFLGVDYQKFRGLPLDSINAELEKRPPWSRLEREKAGREFSADERDQSTPKALALLLEKIFRKEILNPASCELILNIMADCQTGEARIKGELPPGTRVAHKTGTIAGTVNDCGIIYLPNGQGHVILAVLSKNFLGKASEMESVLAKIARFVYDFFYFAP